MLQTCNKIEIPPKPSKNAVNIILIESFLDAILEMLAIPFVISRKPLTKGMIKSWLILSKLKIGVRDVANKSRIPSDLKIDIILEYITTNPPINKIVEIAIVILSAYTSPKLEKDTVLFWDLLKFEVL